MKIYLVSSVFFLKAKPKIEILFPVIVLNSLLKIFLINLIFLNSFIVITCFQYSATSGRL